MKKKLTLLFRLIAYFGWKRGVTVFYQNETKKNGMSSFRLNGFLQPLHLRRGTSDIETFYHVFLNKGYEFKLDYSPTFIVDCGANIGLASVYFKTIYPNAQLVSVEPEQSNYDLLVRNTEKYPGVECIKAGIWNKNAILKVEDELNMGQWGFVCKEVANEDDTTVKALSIGEIMRRYDKKEIDILKIDIETSEKEVFSSNYEDWLPHTRAIVIELHDWLRKGCSRAFFTAVLKYDFSVFQCGEGILCIRN